MARVKQVLWERRIAYLQAKAVIQQVEGHSKVEEEPQTQEIPSQMSPNQVLPNQVSSQIIPIPNSIAAFKSKRSVIKILRREIRAVVEFNHKRNKIHMT